MAEDSEKKIVPFRRRTEGKIVEHAEWGKLKLLRPGARAWVDLDYDGCVPKRFFVRQAPDSDNLEVFDFDFSLDTSEQRLVYFNQIDILYRNCVTKEDLRKNGDTGLLLFYEELILSEMKKNG